MHTAQQLQWQNFGQTLHSQTPYGRAIRGVFRELFKLECLRYIASGMYMKITSDDQINQWLVKAISILKSFSVMLNMVTNAEVHVAYTSTTLKRKCHIDESFHHWLHWKLSFWQLPVQPVMKMSWKWIHFRFSENGRPFFIQPHLYKYLIWYVLSG